jgi:hypothetical protein
VDPAAPLVALEQDSPGGVDRATIEPIEEVRGLAQEGVNGREMVGFSHGEPA